MVASYHNHHDDKPGHIALVRPGTKPADVLETEGPDIIQAGGHNYTSAPLKTGFAGHKYAWETAREVMFFAHAVPKGVL